MKNSRGGKNVSCTKAKPVKKVFSKNDVISVLSEKLELAFKRIRALESVVLDSGDWGEDESVVS